MSEFTLVFDGLISLPSGQNVVTIELDQPFYYEGDNLMVMAHKVYENNYAQNDRFVLTPQSFGNRARYQYSDSNYGGTLPGGGETSATSFPNMRFHILGCNPPTNLAVGFIEDCTIPQLTWTAPSGNIEYLYNIYFDGQLIEENVSDTYYNFNNILFDNTVTHQWCVRTICGNGDESESACLTIEALEVPVATAATNVACNSFVANWNAVTGATDYLLSVYTKNAGVPVYIFTDQPTTNVLSYTVSGLTQGTTYYYNVKAAASCFVSHSASNEIEVAPLVYTINASVEGNGTITPSGEATVDCGTDKTYTFAPANSCYKIVEVLIDGEPDEDAIENGTYTFENISESHTIVVTFAVKEYTITATVNDYGTITPTEATVNCGGSQTFTFGATDECYEIDKVLIDGVNNPIAVAAGSYTFSNVIADHTIDVVIKIKTFTIVATAGSNGTITPSGTITVDCGDDLTFFFEANFNFEVSMLLVDGVNEPDFIAGGFYPFENITGNHTITVLFQSTVVPSAYTITASTDGHATITPSGDITVNPGANQKFTFVAQNGFQIIGVWIDDVNDPQAVIDGFYTFTDVQDDHTIYIESEALQAGEYIIHVTYSQGGSISPNGDVYVTVGGDKTFIITPNNGYKIDKVFVDGIENPAATAAGYYTFYNVQGEHWLTAIFTYISIEQYYINASVSTTGGTVSPSGKVLVTTGDEPTFTFTPQSGYRLKEVLIDGYNDVTAVANGFYTFAPVMSAHTIVGKFEKQDFIITSSMGTAGGTISPIGETAVTYGGSKAYTITAQTGYIIDQVLIDGTNNPTAVSSGKYTFSNVTASHTIVANFKYRTYDITATQTANGSVSPDGVTAVIHGNDMIYNITPNAGYMIKTVLIDGKNNTGAVSAGYYIFTGVTAKHTISATFTPLTGAPIAGDPSGEILLYPNPTTGILHVETQCIASLQSVEIFDMLGRIVETRLIASLQDDTASSLRLDISTLPSGVYFVRIKTETDVVIRKVVKE
jgi:hypothetical protein